MRNKFLLGRKKTTVRHKRVSFTAGFTLVELLVVFFIMASILAVVIPGYLDYSTKLDLENLALDTALVVREAQVYGGGAKISSATTGSSFNMSYGVHFSTIDPTHFILFENSFDNNNNDKKRYTSQDNVISTYTMKTGYSIYALCDDATLSSCASPSASRGSLDIVFARPNPDAYIKTGNGQFTDGSAGFQSTGFVVLVSPDQATTTVQVESTGAISVI